MAPKTLPDIVGSLVAGEYHGTPFEGRVRSLDVFGKAEIDVPAGWTHKGRDYSEGIVTDSDRLTMIKPRSQGKVHYANDTWSWVRGNGLPWPK